MSISQESACPLISIIVPIYNVERYLHRCVDSILAQTYTNIEIVLVNDGSSDSSPAICDEYAKKDNRVRVLHKLNGGPSDARNAGVAFATGELIGFVDGDDYIAPKMYEELFSAMAKYNADLAICGYALTDTDGNVKTGGDLGLKNAVYVANGKPPLSILNLSPGCWVMAWNKLCRRDVIMPFPVGKSCAEDLFVMHHVINKCACVVTLCDALYYYVQRIGSISHVFDVGKLDDVCEARQALFEFCKANKLRRAAGYALIRSAFYCLLGFRLLRNKRDRKQVWLYFRWVSIETLKHPLWFASVLYPETMRFVKKVRAFK